MLVFKKRPFWKFFLELLSYACFTCVLYMIIYSTHGSAKYYQVKHLRRLLLNPENATYSFQKIVTIDNCWNWLIKSFVTNIFVGDWYNGHPINDSSGFLSDKSNRLIGWATMRQLRIKRDTCRIRKNLQGIISHCFDGYGPTIEERGSFFPGWSTNETTQNYSSSIKNAFIYQKSDKLDTYIIIGDHATYGSGGYVYEFRDSLSEITNDLNELRQLSWIDRQTRAIVIQLNLYNPSVPIFTSAVILLELLPSGGVFPIAYFNPLDVSDFTSPYQMACAIIYLLFIAYFMIMEVRSLIILKKSYFRHLWSYIEIGIIACSWGAVGVHIWRVQEHARIANLFRQTHGDVYLNFQLLAYINDLFSFFLAFCCFFGTLKFLRLCRYSFLLSTLSMTLNRAKRELFSFSIMFGLIFMAFLSLFYLQFISFIEECATLLGTAQMLFEILLLKFDATAIYGAAPVLGPLYFSLYVFFIVFVIINMFISIINDNFRQVQAHINTVSQNDNDIFISMFKRIQQWLKGTKRRTNKVNINTKPAIFVIPAIVDPIQRLSNKVDQLLIYVNRHYSEKNKNKTNKHNHGQIRIAWDETAVTALDWAHN